MNTNMENLKNNDDRSSNTKEEGIKSFHRLKMTILMGCFIGVSLLSSCYTPGYVSVEPTYIETKRPNRPSNVHVWVDGDWVWRQQTHNYVYKNGYWSKPYRNKTYISGRWQSTQQGSQWNSGHWQRQGQVQNQRGNNRRNK